MDNLPFSIVHVPPTGESGPLKTVFAMPTRSTRPRSLTTFTVTWMVTGCPLVNCGSEAEFDMCSVLPSSSELRSGVRSPFTAHS